jgi:Acyl-CoA synthetases (AMP-forming)/AMP-acid ligases II
MSVVLSAIFWHPCFQAAVSLCALVSTPLYFGVSLPNSKRHGICIYILIVTNNADLRNAERYYATPTVHQAILVSKPHLTGDLHIRMICNAAGVLLASLAADLKKAFAGTVVLPSYGTTV